MEKHPVVIVTGSSGQIGSAVCDRLDARYRVVGFDRAGPPTPPPSAHVIDVDLSSDSGVHQAIETVVRRHGPNIASVVHLAAYYDFSGKSSPLYDRITVQGTERLLRHLRPLHVEQFIFSSTMLVHAPGAPGRPINEESPLRPLWAYPESKVRAERAIERERGKTSAVMMRIAGVYDDRCHCLPIAQQMHRIYEGGFESHLYPGDLSHGQSLAHIDDVVDAVVRAVERRAALPPSCPLLIGEAEVMSYGALQKAFGRLLRGVDDWTTLRVPKWFAKTGARVLSALPLDGNDFIQPWMMDIADDHYELDISKAHKLLGWKPSHRVEAALESMARALKEDPALWYGEHRLGKPPARALRLQARQAVSPH